MAVKLGLSTNLYKNDLMVMYTRMLCMAINISWRAKLTNEQLYGELPPVSSKVANRRMLIAVYCDSAFSYYL